MDTIKMIPQLWIFILFLHCAKSDKSCKWIEKEAALLQTKCLGKIEQHMKWIVKDQLNVDVWCSGRDQKSMFDQVPPVDEKILSASVKISFFMCKSMPDQFSSVFKVLPQTRSFHIAAFSGQSLNPNFFDAPYPIQSFSVHNLNSLNKKIDERFFFNLVNLERVDLIKLRAAILPASLFINNPSLTHFALKETVEQFVLEERLLANKMNLTHVSIVKTKLRNLPEKSFANSENIEHLDLSYNKLTYIERQIFMELKMLKTLGISGNQLANYDIENQQIMPHQLDNLIINDFNRKVLRWNNNVHDVKTVNLSGTPIETLEVWSNNQRNNVMTFDLSHGFMMSNVNLKLRDLQTFDRYTFIVRKKILLCGKSFKKLLELRDFNKGKVFLDFGDTKCNGPAEMVGLYAQNLSASDVSTNDNLCYGDCYCLFDVLNRNSSANCSTRIKDKVPVLKIDVNYQEKFDLYIDFFLDLSHNSLKTLPKIPSDFPLYLMSIEASNNAIEKLSEENLTDELEVLDLRNNSLRTLTKDVAIRLQKISKLYLGGNPWECSCSTIEFFNFFKLLNKTLVDYNETMCSNLGKRFIDLSSSDVCMDKTFVIAVFVIVFAFISPLMTFFYKYNKNIKIFLYAHNMCLWFVTEEELDKDKIYDAFVCFACPDQTIVEDIILELEKEPNGFRCLVGVRDWMPGEMIPELISASVEQSRRTIVFVSQNFIASQWCRHEFKAAQTESLHEKRKRLIVITHGEIDESELIDEDLKSYMKLHLYIRYDDPRFWRKMIYAMPHKVGGNERRFNRLEMMKLPKDQTVQNGTVQMN